MSVSVRVMKSYDYSHFEVQLGSDNITWADIEAVNNLVKSAQRACDKAIEQYKIAKNQAQNQLVRRERVNQLRREVEAIDKLDERDRTPRQQAKVKACKDRDWQAYIEQRYDYQDDYDDPQYGLDDDD
jgi:predicted ATPase